MTEQIAVPRTAFGEHGWRVTFAGMGINLALGILYTWSVISGGIPEQWGWSQGDKSLPYSICCLVFCLVMVPAGRFQDKINSHSRKGDTPPVFTNCCSWHCNLFCHN